MQSGLAGSAFVAIWHDIVPEGLDDFHPWHDREHMPERLAIPGFLRGRRYRRVERDGPEFFNLYEVATFDVLTGADYLARLDAPTPWTLRAVKHFRNVTRGLCRLAGTTGEASGGFIATVRFAAELGMEGELRRHLVEVALPALALCPGVLAAHVGVADDAASSVTTAEKRARGNPTDIPRWVAMVEGISGRAVLDAAEGAFTARPLASHGLAGEAQVAAYALESERRATGVR